MTPKVRPLRIAFILLALTFVRCAANMPKIDKPVDMGPIKEYDEKLKVKPLEQPAVSPTVPEAAGTTTPVPQASPTPKLGLEPTVKLEVKGKKKKKATGTEMEEVEKKHLPEYEDGEGFVGRRPVVDPFVVGEKLTLMMTYFGVSAGDCIMEVKPPVEVNGRKAYHLQATLKSSAVFSMFYKVDDVAESYFDYDQLVPINFLMSVKETKQLREVRQLFDWKTKKADFWEKKYTQDGGWEEKKKSWDLMDYSQNIFSALWYIRTFAMRDGKTYQYRVSDDGRHWDVKATVVRREMLKTDVGSFKAVVIRPEVFTEGILKPMGEVLFWYTDDDQKLPIKLEAKIKIGKIIAYLKGIERGRR